MTPQEAFEKAMEAHRIATERADEEERKEIKESIQRATQHAVEMTKKTLGIDAEHIKVLDVHEDGTDLEIGGTRFLFNGKSFKRYTACPGCGRRLYGNPIQNLQMLGAELENAPKCYECEVLGRVEMVPAAPKEPSRTDQLISDSEEEARQAGLILNQDSITADGSAIACALIAINDTLLAIAEIAKQYFERDVGELE